MQLGNGRWESTQFNSRLQPTQIALGALPNFTDLLKLDYGYGGASNNGNVQSQTITVPTVGANQGFMATQDYTYDSLNRLKDATELIGGNQAWKQSFTYDRFGNRNFVAAETTTIPAGCPTAVCNPTIDPATNRLVGYTFDNAGNTKIDAENRTFTYDAENKQTEVKDQSGNSIGKYFYDGDGKRVKKQTNTGEVTIFLYDASGKLVAEYANQTPQTPQISYLTSDHLGSPRINTNQTGQVISRHDYHPFGEEIYTPQRNQGVGYQDDAVRKQFATYERDKETSLDFAQARYYGYTFGRFTSPDKPLLDQSSNDPQSWNLYVYAGNSPLKYTDPLGLWKKVTCEGGSSQCWEAEEGDTLDSLADELGVSSKNLNEFFQNQEVVEGRVFDVSGYQDWLKGDMQRGMNDIVERYSKIEPPMGGGLKTVGKVGKASGLFGWIGKQAGRFGRWAGIISQTKAASVAEMAAKQLVGSSGKEMLRDAVNIVKSFKGTPQQKAELFEEFFKQISQRTGGQWNATRQIASDGSAIWTGDAIGRVLVVSPKGEIFSGNLTTDIGGFIFGKGGVITPVYEKLTKIQ